MIDEHVSDSRARENEKAVACFFSLVHSLSVHLFPSPEVKSSLAVSELQSRSLSYGTQEHKRVRNTFEQEPWQKLDCSGTKATVL